MISAKLRAFCRTLGIACASMIVAMTGAVSASANDIVIDSYRIETEDCAGCGVPAIQTHADVAAYMDYMRNALADGDDDDEGSGGYHWYRDDDDDDDDGDRQVVFIDFDAGGEPTFPVCLADGDGNIIGTFGVFQDHVYTQEERLNIMARIKQDYSDFDFKFVTKPPKHGPYSTLSIGANDAPLDCSAGSNITVFTTGGVSILFGRADKIDFLNEDPMDNAFADASLWEFLIQFDPSGFNFEIFSGLTIADFGSVEEAVSQAVVNQTSNTGAHEIGHIQGLRHQNSFGAPGDGLPDTGAISPFEFVPVFDGPSNASETVLHTMASGASVGLSLQGSTITDRFFSERSATRLALNENGRRKSEDRIRRNGRDRIQLKNLKVPNTIIEGQNADARLKVKALVVDGAIEIPGEVDTYSFKGKKGDFFNAELISAVGRNLSFEDGIIGQVDLYLVEKNGTRSLIASNAQSFETVFDAEIFDAVLPVNGTYEVVVSAPDAFYPADFDGDGKLDAFPLSLAGGVDLLAGQYSLQIYTCNKKLRKKDRDDDDDDDD